MRSIKRSPGVHVLWKQALEEADGATGFLPGRGAGDRWFGTVRRARLLCRWIGGTLGCMAPPAGGMGEEPVWVAPVVWAGAAGVDGIPAGGYAGRCRRPGECSGYTWNSPA